MLLCVQQPVIHPGWLLYHVGIFLQIEESVYLSKYTGNGLLIWSADCKPHNVPFSRLNLSWGNSCSINPHYFQCYQQTAIARENKNCWELCLQDYVQYVILLKHILVTVSKSGLNIIHTYITWLTTPNQTMFPLETGKTILHCWCHC